MHYDSISWLWLIFRKRCKCIRWKRLFVVECFEKWQCVNKLHICINEQPEVDFIQCTCAFPERNDGNNRKLKLITTNREINPEFVFCFNSVSIVSRDYDVRYPPCNKSLRIGQNVCPKRGIDAHSRRQILSKFSAPFWKRIYYKRKHFFPSPALAPARNYYSGALRQKSDRL